MTDDFNPQEIVRPRHPHRWFIGPDGLVRPFWRAMAFVLLAEPLTRVVQGLLLTIFQNQPGLLSPFVQSAGFSVAWLLLSWLLLVTLDKRSFRALGLWFYGGWLPEFLIGIGIGAGMICLVVAIERACGVIHYDGLTANLAGALRNAGKLAGLLFVAATAEEILFRGYGFQRFVDSIGSIAAVAGFSVLFGAVHLANPSATWLSTVNTILAGVLLAVAYLKTRALWLPIGLHWAWNYFMTAILSLPVSGFQFGEKLFRVEITGPVWLSGGTYGPEGSVVLTVVATAAIVALARSKRISPSPAMEQALKSSLR